MKYLLIAFIFFSYGCAKNDINPTLQKYFTSFSFYFNQPLPNIITKYESLPEEAIATARTKYDPITKSIIQRYIIVDQFKFSQLCEEQKQNVIWHEIGHHIGREHEPIGTISIMEPKTRSCDFYKENIDQLIKEMFN